MRLAAITLSVMLAAPMFADPIHDVANAETAFARAFTDRDPAKFFAMVANDANFLGALGTLRGKQAIVDRWSRFFQAPQAPFVWGPERVEVTADGKLGLSAGPIYDAKGHYTGDYSSIWQKQSDGSWKVIFDGPGSAPAEVGKVEEGFVNADDGLKLYYRKFGDGPVTLIVPLDYFLHDHFRQFANVATVVTYDLRNRGRSHRSKDESTWTIQQDARDLEAVRRELKIEKFVPIGFSYLGVVVAMYTLDHPDRVSRLVQIDPAPFRKFPDQPPLKEDYGIPAETEKRLNDLRAAGAYEKSPREFCTAIWDFYRYMFVGNPAHAERFDLSFCELENEWPVNFNPHVEHVMKSFANVDLTAEKLHGVKVPVLTIHGTKDRAAPYAGAVEWVKAFADARLVTVEGVAHAAWLDDPVTVFASIRHFLRGEWPLAATSPPR